MKHFNKLKKQIRQEKTVLPDGFGWEDMQSGIYDKIDDEIIPNNNSFKFFNTSFLIYSCVLIGVAFVSILFFQKEQTKHTELTSNIELKKDTESTTEARIVKDHPSDISNSNVETNVEAQIESDQQSTNSSKSLQNNKPLNNEIYTKKIKLNQSLVQSESELEKVSRGFNSLSSKTKKSKYATGLNHLSTRKHAINPDFGPLENGTLNKSKLSPNLASPKDRIAQKEIPGVTLNKENRFIPNDEKMPLHIKNAILKSADYLPRLNAKNLKTQVKNTLQSPEMYVAPLATSDQGNLWSLELGGGWNTWSYGLLNSETQQDLYANNNAEYGYSFSSRLTRKANDKLSVFSGLDVDIMYKKLEITFTELDDREVKNVVLSYKTNSLTGITKATIGDTVVVDTTIFTVNNFNEYRVVSIPLIMNYNILKNSNWNLNIGLGPSVSFLTNYQGKYVEDNELKNFDSTSNLYSSSPKLAINASLQLRRKMINDFYLGFRIDFKNHISNWASNTENGLKPRIVSGFFVIGKEF